MLIQGTKHHAAPGTSEVVKYRYGVDQARYLKHEQSVDEDGVNWSKEVTLYGLGQFEEVTNQGQALDREAKSST